MYFITTVNKDDSRCVGYLSDIKQAINIVRNNKYDLYEAGCYPYVVIEHISEGIYQYDFNPLWFEYNEEIDKYIALIEPPFATDKTVGYAIG